MLMKKLGSSLSFSVRPGCKGKSVVSVFDLVSIGVDEGKVSPMSCDDDIV